MFNYRSNFRKISYLAVSLRLPLLTLPDATQHRSRANPAALLQIVVTYLLVWRLIAVQANLIAIFERLRIPK